MSALLVAIKGWLNAGLAFAYPEVCQLCGEMRASPAENYVCENCRAEVQLIEPPFCERCGLPFEGAITGSFECSNCREADWQFSSARSAAVAKGKLRDVIHRYKYQRAFWFEGFLAGLLIARGGPELRGRGWDCIVPVPLHPAKQREREFNQAERLARRLADAINVPVNAGILRRRVPTRTQTRLTREQRLANVRGAFACVEGACAAGQRFIVVDDVLTTGATTSACALALRQGGAADVCVWTVARGI